jgi:hypothetical protein
MVDRHFAELRRSERYKRCHIRVFIECNLSYLESKRIADLLHSGGHGGLEIVRFDKRNGVDRYGIRTTADSKKAVSGERGGEKRWRWCAHWKWWW